MTVQITPNRNKKQLFEEKKRKELAEIEAKIAYLKAKWGFVDFEKENSNDI